jgi:hypothetical protein
MEDQEDTSVPPTLTPAEPNSQLHSLQTQDPPQFIASAHPLTLEGFASPSKRTGFDESESEDPGSRMKRSRGEQVP